MAVLLQEVQEEPSNASVDSLLRNYPMKTVVLVKPTYSCDTFEFPNLLGLYLVFMISAYVLCCASKLVTQALISSSRLNSYIESKPQAD